MEIHVRKLFRFKRLLPCAQASFIDDRNPRAHLEAKSEDLREYLREDLYFTVIYALVLKQQAFFLLGFLITRALLRPKIGSPRESLVRTYLSTYVRTTHLGHYEHLFLSLIILYTCPFPSTFSFTRPSLVFSIFWSSMFRHMPGPGGSLSAPLRFCEKVVTCHLPLHIPLTTYH